MSLTEDICKSAVTSLILMGCLFFGSLYVTGHWAHSWIRPYPVISHIIGAILLLYAIYFIVNAFRKRWGNKTFLYGYMIVLLLMAGIVGPVIYLFYSLPYLSHEKVVISAVITGVSLVIHRLINSRVNKPCKEKGEQSPFSEGWTRGSVMALGIFATAGVALLIAFVVILI